MLDGDSTGQPKPLDIPPREGDCFFTEISGEDHRVFEVMPDRRRDATAAGTQIQYARRFHPGGVAGQLQDIFNQRFRIGSGDQHIAIDFKFQVGKVGGPGEILNGFLFRRALNE